MYFLFSGEGATDLGICDHSLTRCESSDYQHGPMTIIVDHIVQECHRYSVLDTGQYGYVSKSYLTQRAAALKAVKKSMRLPGKKREKETHYFFNNARVLARIAQEKRREIDDEVVAVLFRDADGTGSAGRGMWSDKQRAMLNGFAEEGFCKGVPMLPKPKSEAWVICALKFGYSNCNSLEDRSGNDASPHSLKKELETHLGGLPTREALCEMVEKRTIDVGRIRMPSFDAFRTRLEQVI